MQTLEFTDIVVNQKQIFNLKHVSYSTEIFTIFVNFLTQNNSLNFRLSKVRRDKIMESERVL